MLTTTSPPDTNATSNPATNPTVVYNLNKNKMERFTNPFQPICSWTQHKDKIFNVPIDEVHCFVLGNVHKFLIWSLPHVPKMLGQGHDYHYVASTFLRCPAEISRNVPENGSTCCSKAWMFVSASLLTVTHDALGTNIPSVGMALFLFMAIISKNINVDSSYLSTLSHAGSVPLRCRALLWAELLEVFGSAQSSRTFTCSCSVVLC